MIQRQVAYRVSISDLNKGQFVKGEGEWDSNYIVVDGKKISRVNLIGAIIEIMKDENNSYFNSLIDDGTGNIRIRGWKEEINLFDGLNVGDLVLLVGKIKDYTGSVYITPEIVRKLENKKWLELRKLEIKQNGSVAVVDDIRSGVVDKLKELDNSDGIEISELSRLLRVAEEEVERVIEELIKDGEIYQVRPGFLRLM